jgi:hypothetical protein
MQWHWSTSLPSASSNDPQLIHLNAGQYDAWCRNDGNHSTAKRGHVNWNAELIWKMKTEQAFNWDVLEDQIPEIFESLSSNIVRSLQQFGALVNGKSGALFLAMLS